MVKDYKNPNCISCNDCCGATTLLSGDEYRELSKFLEGDGAQLLIDGKALFDEHMSNDILYGQCLFSDALTKKCKIYDRRPRICREFHCGSNPYPSKVFEPEMYIVADLFLAGAELEFLKSTIYEVQLRELRRSCDEHNRGIQDKRGG